MLELMMESAKQVRIDAREREDTPLPDARQYFRDAMNYLRAGYPQYRPAKTDWEALVHAYGHGLRAYSSEVIRVAVNRAHQAHPRFFPSLGEIRELCEAAHRDGVSRNRWQQTQKRPKLAGGVPRTPQAQAKYIGDAAGWEALARLWEVESQKLRLNQNEASPREVTQRRFRDFWKHWNNQQRQAR